MRQIKFLKDFTVVGILNLELVEDGVIPAREVKVTFRKNETYSMHEWAQEGDVTSLTTDDKSLMGKDAVEGDTLTFSQVPLSVIEGLPDGFKEEDLKTLAASRASFVLPTLAHNLLLEETAEQEENDPVLC